MNREAAVAHLLQALPEFVSYYEDSLAAPTEPGDQLLIHVVMGDLARFYMENAINDQELARRYWSVVEDLAANGDQAVENAVHVSLIEWFAWGDEDEKAALLAASGLHGPATRRIVAFYSSDLQ